MSFESPVSVLYNSEGLEIALSQSQVISASAQPGLVIAGSGSDGRAYFFRVSNDGSLFITGAIQTSAVATQSVFVAGYAANITGSFKLDAWATTVTGAVGVTGWLPTVTGNVKLDGWGTGVTGAVSLVPSASVIVGGFALAATASTREIGASTTTVSAAQASLTNFTLLNANPNRRGATFFKEGSNICYLKLGSTATATSYTVKLSNNGYYELPEYYSGRIDIIFSTATAGNPLYVTELVLP